MGWVGLIHRRIFKSGSLAQGQEKTHWNHVNDSKQTAWLEDRESRRAE